MDFPNLSNLFRPTTATSPAPGASVATAGQTPATKTPPPNDPAAGLQQNNPAADPANQNLDSANLGGDGKNKGAPGSELDAFTDIFKIDPNKQPPKDPTKEPLLTLDPAKIAAAVAKMDFTRGIDPALTQKALQGDVGSFAAVLNSVARNSYMGSFQALTGILERAIATNNERFNSTLSTKFRDFAVNSSASKNPVLNHPSVKPVLASLKQLIAQQRPELSPEAVASEAEQYFLSMGKGLSSLEADINADANKDKKEAGVIDWEKHFISS